MRDLYNEILPSLTVPVAVLALTTPSPGLSHEERGRHHICRRCETQSQCPSPQSHPSSQWCEVVVFTGASTIVRMFAEMSPSAFVVNLKLIDMRKPSPPK